MDESFFSARHLEKSYGGRAVVSGLSFEVKKGEVVGLLGPNGAGKTTAFYMAVGLIQPDGGQVIFDGKDVTKKPIHERARMGMGYLAQEPSVFRALTVEENLLCILENLPLTKPERNEKLEELLAEFHLEKLTKKRAGTLSGGERRRLEIARSLITKPTFLLLDEPFANIDPISVFELQELIRHLSKRGISILITDHNAREIFSIAERCYLVFDGKTLFSGSVEELLSHEEAKRTYLGSAFKM